MIRALKLLASIGICCAISAADNSSAPAEPSPEDGVRAVIKCFDRDPAVIIGEGHGLKEAGDFYTATSMSPT